MAEIILLKMCSKCRKEKPPSEFFRCKTWRDGLDYNCKVCRKESNDCQYAKVSADPEKLNERRKYGNRKQKEKRINDPAWREKLNAYRRQHYRENKGQYYANVSKRKARKLGGGGSHSDGAWRQLLELFGGKCLCCGRTEKITRDHVIPLSNGGSDNIENMQPMCLKCNKSKFTQGVDFRSRDKVVLPVLNDVGRLIFKEGELTPEAVAKLRTHKAASRFTGVGWAPKNDRTVKPWRAVITVNKKRFNLGRFKTEEEAALAYNEAARKYHGESAFQNSL